MRELILDKIEAWRIPEQGFNSGRWGRRYLHPQTGIEYYSNKKDKHTSGGQHAIALNKTTRENFAALDDEVLMETFIRIVRIMSKQM